MISEESRDAIDALSLEELLYEVMADGTSRFQGEKRDYLMARFAIMEKRGEDDHRKQVLELAQEANEIARSANRVAARAERWAMYAALAAVIALVISVIGLQKH